MRVHTWSLANSGHPVTSLPRMGREILPTTELGGAPLTYVRPGMDCRVRMTERGMPVPIGATWSVTHRVATVAGVRWGLRVTNPSPLTFRPLLMLPQGRSSRIFRATRHLVQVPNVEATTEF